MPPLAVRDYRLPRKYQDALAHVEKIAADAARLVEKRMGVALDRTEIVVTTNMAAVDYMIIAHRSMFGQSPHIWTLKQIYGDGECGATTLGKTAIIALVNADRCQPYGRLNETVLHELGHAAQMSRPGGREIEMDYLRNNYGIARMRNRDVRVANRRVEEDEREAERLEALAAELPGWGRR